MEKISYMTETDAEASVKMSEWEVLIFIDTAKWNQFLFLLSFPPSFFVRLSLFSTPHFGTLSSVQTCVYSVQAGTVTAQIRTVGLLTTYLSSYLYINKKHLILFKKVDVWNYSDQI